MFFSVGGNSVPKRDYRSILFQRVVAVIFWWIINSTQVRAQVKQASMNYWVYLHTQPE